MNDREPSHAYRSLPGGGVRFVSPEQVAEESDLLAHPEECKRLLAEARFGAPNARTAPKPDPLRSIPSIWRYEPKPLSWVLPDIVFVGGITLLCALSGEFKTWLSLATAKAVVHRGGILGREAEHCKVIYFDRENPACVIRQRLENLAFRESPDFVWWGLAFDPSPPLLESEDFYLSLVKAQDRPPLLIFDSLVRFHRAESENSASDMSRVMSALRRIASVGAAVLVLHHLGKSEASDYRGSSDIQAGVDISLTVKRDSTEALRLSSTKNRVGEPFTISMNFDLKQGGFIVIDDPELARRETEFRAVAEHIGGHPGICNQDILDALSHRIVKGRLREILRFGEKRGAWHILKGAHNRSEYHPGSAPEVELDF